MSEMVPTFIIETILSEDERNVSLRATAKFVNESVCPKLSLDFILQLLDKKGFGKFSVAHDAVEEIIEALLEALEQIESEEDTEGLNIETDSIAEAIDAQAEAEISEDKFKAIVSITPAKGGKNLTVTEIEEILEEAGVSYGIDQTLIEDLLKQSNLSPVDEICSAPVALALMPVAGDDAQFEPLVETANERILKPRLKEDGTVDMLDLGDMPTVKAGAALLKKIPLTKGDKGINVCWGVLAPDPGADLDFKPGSGTQVREDDEFILESTIAGQPNLLERGMKVDDAIKVKAVDLSTGHITTDANLIVKGDILKGMKVRCDGDLTVGGVIESADVIAKGNIVVGKGILGKTNEHRGNEDNFSVSIKAGGTIYGVFASYAKLESANDIIMSEQLLHCDTTTKGQVTVGNKKTVGSQIVGGITRSEKAIVSDILGASAGVKTYFDLSGPYKVKHYELACNRSIIEGKSTMLDNMRGAYSKFMNVQMTESRKIHIDKIKNTIHFLEKEINSLENQSEVIEKESEVLCHGLVVRAKRKIQPGVSVVIGKNKLKITRPREAGEIYYEGDELQYYSSIKAD